MRIVKYNKFGVDFAWRNIKMSKTLSKELSKIESWLSKTTEEFDDWDWDGETLTLFLNSEVIEKYDKDEVYENIL